MNACTCAHTARQHIAPGRRCRVPSCDCLFGPLRPTPRPMPERTRRHTDVAEDGTVVKTETDRERLERMLWDHLNDAGLPAPETQYRWAPGRQFRADFAYPAERILIEVQGGIWARDPGRHNRASGYQADLARSNLAQQLGWRLYAFTEKMIRSEEAVETIRRALEASAAATHQLALTGGAATDAE